MLIKSNESVQWSVVVKSWIPPSVEFEPWTLRIEVGSINNLTTWTLRQSLWEDELCSCNEWKYLLFKAVEAQGKSDPVWFKGPKHVLQRSTYLKGTQITYTTYLDQPTLIFSTYQTADGIFFFFFFFFRENKTTFHVSCLPSRLFRLNAKSYFLWKNNT